MRRAQTTFDCVGGSRFLLQSFGCVILAIGLARALSIPAAAGDRDCSAISQEPLNVELTSTASAVRQVSLNAGDTLAFTFRAGPARIGSLTLRKGPGAPRRLLAGPSGTTVSYVASTSGRFSFRFATEGGEGGAFAATCTPAKIPQVAAAGRSSAAAHEASTLIAQNRNRLRVLPENDIDGLVIDSSGTFKSGLPGDTPSAPDLGVPQQSTRKFVSDARLQWEGAPNGAGGPPGADRVENAGPAKLGVKFKLQPAIMIGVLAQFDSPGEMLLERNWLAGPVTKIQLAPGMALDARAAWGSSAQDGALNSHGSDRRLLDARLSSTQMLGALRFSPSIGVNFVEEARHFAAAAAPEASGPQTIGSGRMDISPELAYRIDMGHSMFIEPKAMIGGIWEVDNLWFGPGIAPHTAVRLKAETGVTIGNTQGTKLQIGGRVEEGGSNATNVWSGRLQLNVPLK